MKLALYCHSFLPQNVNNVSYLYSFPHLLFLDYSVRRLVVAMGQGQSGDKRDDDEDDVEMGPRRGRRNRGGDDDDDEDERKDRKTERRKNARAEEEKKYVASVLRLQM